MDTLVNLQHVSFKYEGRANYALRSTSLELKAGEFVLLLGATGAGKSTLLRTLNGLIPHFYRGEFEGRVVVDGVDTRDATVAELATTVGLLFQNPDNQIVTLNVERELAFGLENLGLSRAEVKKRVLKYLDQFGLMDLRDRAPYELSGGEKRLVTLASVVAMEPKLLALDEPTSELDKYGARKLVEVLAALNEEGKIILVAEHRVDLLAPLATRVIVMDAGEVIGDGGPRDVLSDLSTLRRAKVKPPRMIQLSDELKRRGIPIQEVPLELSELINLLSGDRN